MPVLVLLVTHLVLGAGVKYIDAAYDDGTFSKRCTFLVAIQLGIGAGITMIFAKPSLIIFLSVIIGVIFTGKLDIGPFRIMTLVALLLPYIYNNASLPLTYNEWALVFCMSAAAAIDEIGNDLADNNTLHGTIAVFFLYRSSLKIFLVLTAVLNYLPIMYSIAFFCFDLGYLLVTLESERRQETKLPSVISSNTVTVEQS